MQVPGGRVDTACSVIAVDQQVPRQVEDLKIPDTGSSLER